MRAAPLIATLILMSQSGGANATESWVLGPQAQMSIKQLAQGLATTAGCVGLGVQVERGAIQAPMRCADGVVYTLTISARSGDDKAIPTLTGAESFVAATRETLERLVSESDLGWRRVGPRTTPRYPIDEARRSIVLRERARAMRREAPETETATAPADIPSLDDMVSARNPRTLGYLVSKIRLHRGSPRLWQAAATRALSQDQVHEAGAMMDVAARMTRANADTWDAQAQMLDAGEADTLSYLALLILCLGLWGALLRQQQRRSEQQTHLPVVVGVGIGLIVASYALFTTPEVRPAIAPVMVPEPLIAPLAGGDCAADPALWTTQGWELYSQCQGAPVRFIIRSDGDVIALADEHTEVVSAASAHLKALVAPLIPLATRPSDMATKTDEGAASGAPSWARTFGLWICLWGLLAALWLHLGMISTIRREVAKDRYLAWGFGALCMALLIIHIITPSRLVMVYTGYDLTAALGSALPTPRYGPGGVGLYGPWLAWFGLDHANVQIANRVFGCLGFIPLAAITLALGHPHRWLVGLSCGLYVFLPLIWRDHTSEGIGPGVMWLVLTALAPWVSSPRLGPRGVALVMSLPVLVFAMLCRPEAIAALGVCLLGLLALNPQRDRGLRLSLCLMTGLLTLPHLNWLWGTALAEAEHTSIAQLDATMAERLFAVLLRDNIVLHGPWLPNAVWLWSILGVLYSRGWARQVGLVLTLAGVAWMAVTAVDLPLVSIPRVHLPVLILTLPLIGLGAQGVEKIRYGRWINVLLLLVTVASAAHDSPAVLAQGHNDREDALIRQAAQLAKADPETCISTLDYEDPPRAGKTQRQFPRYLFQGHELMGLTRWSREGQHCTRTLFILGHRCYMAMRHADQPAPPAASLLPACATILERGDIQSIETREVPNQATTTFPMYPDATSLNIGIFEHQRVNLP